MLDKRIELRKNTGLIFANRMESVTHLSCISTLMKTAITMSILIRRIRRLKRLQARSWKRRWSLIFRMGCFVIESERA